MHKRSSDKALDFDIKSQTKLDKILLIEPLASGHHAQYIRWIANSLQLHGHSGQIATFESSLRHPLYKPMLEKKNKKFEFVTLPDPKENGFKNAGFFSLVRRELGYWNILKKLYKQAVRDSFPDLVFIPYLDYCAYAIGLLGSPFEQTPWAGIVMRPAFHYPYMGIAAPSSRLHIFKKWLFFKLLRKISLKAVFTIDLTLAEYMKAENSYLNKRLFYLPDPILIKEYDITCHEARDELGIPQNVPLLLVYGCLSFRKGIDALLKAANENAFPKEVHILLAGPQDQYFSDLVRSPIAQRLHHSGRLHEINQYLSGRDEFMVFKAANIIWLGYRRFFGMSAVLVQAAAFGLPVIGCNKGLIGRLIERHNNGIVLDIDNSEEIVSAVRSLLLDKKRFRKYVANGQEAYADHSIEYNSRLIIDVLRN